MSTGLLYFIYCQGRK